MSLPNRKVRSPSAIDKSIKAAHACLLSDLHFSIRCHTHHIIGDLAKRCHQLGTYLTTRQQLAGDGRLPSPPNTPLKSCHSLADERICASAATADVSLKLGMGINHAMFVPFDQILCHNSAIEHKVALAFQTHEGSRR